MSKEIQTMIIPNYYQAFKCIGGQCEDTCCGGWMLPVDEATYNKYKKVKHPEMKKRLAKELVAKKGSCDPENAAKIKQKNNRCAFLTKEGWCDIYIQLGENYLSHSCQLYPRTTNKVGGQIEFSLTASCPEAARCMLLNPEGIQFEKEEGSAKGLTISATVKVNEKDPKEWRDYLFTIRDEIIGILQNRNEDFEKRLGSVGSYLEEIDTLIQKGQIKKIPSILGRTKAKVKSTEESMMEPEQLIRVAEILKVLFKEKKESMIRYQRCLEDMFIGLEIDGEKTTLNMIKKYEEGIEKYYRPFLEDKGYILENYLVNYLYERCMPLDGKTPVESYKRMVLYYGLIKLHLVGIANKEGQLTEDKVIEMIQAFTKTYDHGKAYIEKIKEFI